MDTELCEEEMDGETLLEDDPEEEEEEEGGMVTVTLGRRVGLEEADAH